VAELLSSKSSCRWF